MYSDHIEVFFAIQALVQMPHDAPGRLQLMRKYAAIYGRFDSKRKNEKPMSLHEVNYIARYFGIRHNKYIVSLM